jgi:hypothetical protein
MDRYTKVYYLKLKKDAKWQPSVYTTVVPARLWPSLENRLIMRVTGLNASLRHKGSFQSL